MSLGQIGVLHYHNNQEPGEAVNFKCGYVWFTVTVRRARNEKGEEPNLFRTRDIALPIINTCLWTAAIVTLPIGIVVEIPVVAASVVAVAGIRGVQGARIAGIVFAGAATGGEAMDGVMRSPQHYEAKKRGVYANGKTLHVTGGGESAMIITESPS